MCYNMDTFSMDDPETRQAEPEIADGESKPLVGKFFDQIGLAGR